MTASNEQQVAERLAKLLRATRANDAETAPKRPSRQTDYCPSIPRFAAVLRRNPDRTQQDDWTPEEARHTGGCAFCQDVFRKFAAASAALAAAVAHDDTITNMDTSQETQVGPPLQPEKSGAVPEPPAPRAEE